MIEHCFERSRFYRHWEHLAITTCDKEIKSFCSKKKYPVVMTSDTHTRALDRVAEAAQLCGKVKLDDDIVVCVQGDEPLVTPDLIDEVTRPFHEDPDVDATMLAIPIIDKEVFINPDTVKLVHDLQRNVLYTSRSPIPYAEEFNSDLGALRVGGIFGFKWKFLRWFTLNSETPLEIKESCDSNRIYEHGFTQRAAVVSYRPYLSVDSPSDIGKVEKALPEDQLWGAY